MDDKVEEKIRDALIRALKSYFKSDKVEDQDQRDTEDSLRENNNPKERVGEPSAIIPFAGAEGNFDGDEQGPAPDNIDLSNLFVFPEANAPHKTFTFSFQSEIGKNFPNIKFKDELDPGIMDDFMNFMGMLGISSDEITDVLEEMSHMAMSGEVGNIEKKTVNIPEQQGLFHDIFEEGDQISVVVELPGLEKDQIELNVAHKLLEINGKIIDLPANIDQDHVKARMNNGILEVKLRKITEKTPGSKIRVD